MIRLLLLPYYPDCFHSFQASLSFPCSAVLDPPLFRSFPKSSPSERVDYPFGHHSTLASASLLLLMLFVPSAWILVTWLQHWFIIVVVALVSFLLLHGVIIVVSALTFQCCQFPLWGSCSHLPAFVGISQSVVRGCQSCPAVLGVRFDWVAVRAVSAGVHDLCVPGFHLVPGCQSLGSLLIQFCPPVCSQGDPIDVPFIWVCYCMCHQTTWLVVVQ